MVGAWMVRSRDKEKKVQVFRYLVEQQNMTVKESIILTSYYKKNYSPPPFMPFFLKSGAQMQLRHVKVPRLGIKLEL